VSGPRSANSPQELRLGQRAVNYLRRAEDVFAQVRSLLSNGVNDDRRYPNPAGTFRFNV
jgi:hypothetical protein